VPPARLTSPLGPDAEAMGALIRTRRRATGLTLTQLAARTGLSHSFLSLLERGYTRPSLPSLAAISQALDLSALDVLGQVDRAMAETLGDDPASHPEIPFDPGGTSRVLYADPNALTVSEVSALPSVRFVEHHVHADTELLYVLEGTARVEVDGAETFVSRGDVHAIPAGRSHRWSAAGDDRLRVLVLRYGGAGR
jgi:quercetin dioxygenase-like cupin family protein